MSVELKPVGMTCHMGCAACYEEPMRDAGNYRPKNYDLDKMLETAKKTGQKFSVFGGEPLLTPIADLEKIFKVGFELNGASAIQTNGDLITDEHIKLFEKYNVGVGVSCEGPEDLNKHRQARTRKNVEEETLKRTRQTIQNIKKLRDADVSVSVISSFYKHNASKDRLPKFLEWGDWLASIGVYWMNIHTLETESPKIKAEWALEKSEEIEAFLTVANWLKTRPNYRWQPFMDIKQNLQADDNQSLCVWHNCDPFTTAAVQGIESDGSMSNCGRTNKEGVNWYKADKPGFERYLCLYQTPQEYLGCKDCRFFLTCGGECPGASAMSNNKPDWRNRTDHCSTIMALHEFYEKELLNEGILPLSLHPERKKIEELHLQFLKQGKKTNLGYLLNAIESKNDVSAEQLNEVQDHLDTPHKDTPHIDTHADHTDASHNDTEGFLNITSYEDYVKKKEDSA